MAPKIRSGLRPPQQAGPALLWCVVALLRDRQARFSRCACPMTPARLAPRLCFFFNHLVRSPGSPATPQPAAVQMARTVGARRMPCNALQRAARLHCSISQASI
ncbi:hypothetical protein B0J12DRAFT_696644 [Macrophomina phaseolina]|uniref:Secreted protein n=1 Tax=Macrophomina phaseolina TaxID=35725 RepID=A0ABQ8GKP0_9PEZI|nr:hypothetical protein B0J12DRAFT_696644 [Macrophomina phaseolina]